MPKYFGGDNMDDQPQPLSKNAIKKAAKAQRLAAIKLERRARERIARKEKKAEKRAAGQLDERPLKRPRIEFGGHVVVDLGFDELMSEKEINSLCSQLAYTYSANRQSSFPFSLTFTSLNGKTLEKLESMNQASYKRWANTEWCSEGFESLWDPGTSSRQPREKQTFVYLTADTEDELLELKPEETYIIGGICDHNRYKNLCLNKSTSLSIRSARLPIGTYLSNLQTRKVLTVNQVFEILVKWVETKSWEEALYAVIPKRKFNLPGGGGGGEGGEEEEEGGEQEEGGAKEKETVVVEEAEIVQGTQPEVRVEDVDTDLDEHAQREQEDAK